MSRRRVARREAALTVPAPELQPHVAESLTSACGGWLVIWSPWRRTYTAFGAATSERTIIDEPTVHGLLDRIDQVEAALTRATAGPASHRRSPLPRLIGPPHVLRW